MQDYQKAELTAKILMAFDEANHIETPLQRLQFEKIINGTIMDYFKDKADIEGFGIEDIKEEAERDGYECSDEVARDVLAYLDKHFDATIGINWNVISMALDEKEFKDRMKELPESEEDDG